jgi:hypothetical protein
MGAAGAEFALAPDYQPGDGSGGVKGSVLEL